MTAICPTRSDATLCRGCPCSAMASTGLPSSRLISSRSVASCDRRVRRTEESGLKARSWCLVLVLLACVAPVAACTQVPGVSHSPAATSSVGATSSASARSAPTGRRVAAVSDITWKGYFGSDHANPAVAYTLLALDFFQGTTSLSATATINNWVKAHPDAQVVPVMEYERSPDGTRLVWVWLVDGQSNLNLELVRSGACQAATMTAPDGLKLLVPQAQFDAFEAELARLEKLARHDRLGIWR